MTRFGNVLMSCFWNAKGLLVIRPQIGLSPNMKFARAAPAKKLLSQPAREGKRAQLTSPGEHLSRAFVTLSQPKVARVVWSRLAVRLLLHGLNSLRPDLLALNLRNIPSAA